MHDIPIHGLLSIERQDEIIRVMLGSSPDLDLIEAAFPDRFSLTLTPDGAVTLLLPATALDSGLSMLPPTLSCRVYRGMTAFRVSGVCMSAAGDQARRICAALARAGICPHALSLCDLGLSFAVDGRDADRTAVLIEAAIPLISV